MLWAILRLLKLPSIEPRSCRHTLGRSTHSAKCLEQLDPGLEANILSEELSDAIVEGLYTSLEIAVFLN